MIELLLRLFGLLMLAGGALTAAIGIGEYGRAMDTPGALGTQLALQFRIDLTDAGLLLGGGLLCVGMAAIMTVLVTPPERPVDPYVEQPSVPAEMAHESRLPDPDDPHG